MNKNLDIILVITILGIITIYTGFTTYMQVTAQPVEIESNGCMFDDNMLSFELLNEMYDKNYTKYPICKHNYCFHEWGRDNECRYLGVKDGSGEGW